MKCMKCLLVSAGVVCLIATGGAEGATLPGGHRPTQMQDIVDLIAGKQVEVKAQGAGIQSVEVKMRRLVPRPLPVRIPIGTFFVSGSGSAQNMVATEERTVVLRGADWTSVSVAAACANLAREIPGNDDSFTLHRSPSQEELSRLMPVLEKARLSFEARQAAVWIVTDDSDYEDLGSLVTGFGGFGPRAIQEKDAARAMQLVDQAGIDITRKAIWRDRETILRGLKDQALRRWLQQRGERR